MDEKKIKIELTGIPPIKLEIPKPTPMIPKLLENYIKRLESEHNECMITCSELFSDNLKLEEENKELKAWKKRMIEFLSNWFEENEYISVRDNIIEICNEIGFDIDE